MSGWASRPNGAVSGADRNRELRKRKIADGTTQTLFDSGEFVAVDGEGFSEGPELTFSVKDGKATRTYTTQAHHYAYLAASDGSEAYAPAGRLRTQQCLDFLLDIRINNPKAILVTFGASYDMTQMLMDLDRTAINTLLHGDGSLAQRRHVDVTLGGFDYRIEFRPRKQLSVWRWPGGFPKHEEYITRKGEAKWRMTPCEKVTLWDCWGFFQGSFKQAMKDWLPDDPDYAFIEKMKGDREIFERSEMPEIRRYNQAELRCLVAMMELLRGSLQTIGARISRWDGAGAIAAAMLRAHGVAKCMAEPPGEVRQAALHAYSGGHIEAMAVGAHNGPVHHYDRNSAYPAEAAGLPDLSAGEWKHGGSANMGRLDGAPPDGFTICRVSWRFKPGEPFYPLFYRTEQHAILYPERGHGWYWLPEIKAAQAFADKRGAIEFTIHEYRHFEEQTAHRPFAFIPEIYAERQRIIAEAKKRGKPDGRQIAIRLGLNAMYGKLAQQVGAKKIAGHWRLPTFFQLEWAGWITSGCRASLMLAALQKPDAIVAIATDGIFATEPLDLNCPAEKVLGEWEYKQHEGITMVMPGVYWTGPTTDGKEQWKHYSRGFDKKAMSDQSHVMREWRRGKEWWDAPSRRMVTMGQALTSDTFWDMRGMFVKTTRRLRLDGLNSKRHGVAMTQVKPARGLVRTYPLDLPEYYSQSLEGLLSEPYPVVWMRDGKDLRPPIDPAHEAEQAARLS